MSDDGRDGTGDHDAGPDGSDVPDEERVAELLRAFLAAHPASFGAADIEAACVGLPPAVAATFRRLLRGLSATRESTAREGTPDEPVDRDLESALDGLAGRVPLEERYVDPEWMASGGMSELYRAWDVDLGCPVALKVARYVGEPAGSVSFPAPDGTGSDGAPHTERRRRLLREARITGSLDHPAIVPVHAVGVDGARRPFIVEKLVVGRTFTDLVAEVHAAGGEALEQAAGLLMRVAHAAGHAHAVGVVHRDIKSDNILVETDRASDDVVFLMDWGLARRLTEESAGVDLPPALLDLMARAARHGATVTEAVGTLAFAAPEQLRGAFVDARADVYSLGAVLYHVLTGIVPYSRPEEAGEAVAKRRPPTPVLALRPELGGDGLVAICEKAMALRADDRYPDGAAFAEALRSHLDYWSPSNVEVRRQLRRNRLLVDFHHRVLSQASLDVARGALMTIGDAVETAARQVQPGRLDPEDEQLLRHLVGVHLREQGRFADSEAHLRRACELSAVVTDGDDMFPWVCQAALATTLKSLRRSEAHDLMREAFDALDRIDGLDPVTLQVGLEYAELLRWADELEEADARYRRVEAAARAAARLGDVGVLVQEALVGRALMMLRHGRAREAATVLQQAIGELGATVGEDHPLAVTARLELGQALGRADDGEGALRETARAAVLLERVFGERHPHTLTAGNNLAKALMMLSRYAEALERTTETLGVARARDGDDSKDRTLMALLAAHGEALLGLGRAREALAPLEEACRRAHGALGPQHSYTHAARLFHGRALLACGRFPEARAAALAVLLPEPAPGTTGSRFAGRAVTLLRELRERDPEGRETITALLERLAQLGDRRGDEGLLESLADGSDG